MTNNTPQVSFVALWSSVLAVTLSSCRLRCPLLDSHIKKGVHIPLSSFLLFILHNSSFSPLVHSPQLPNQQPPTHTHPQPKQEQHNGWSRSPRQDQPCFGSPLHFWRLRYCRRYCVSLPFFLCCLLLNCLLSNAGLTNKQQRLQTSLSYIGHCLANGPDVVINKTAAEKPWNRIQPHENAKVLFSHHTLSFFHIGQTSHWKQGARKGAAASLKSPFFLFTIKLNQVKQVKGRCDKQTRQYELTRSFFSFHPLSIWFHHILALVAQQGLLAGPQGPCRAAQETSINTALSPLTWHSNNTTEQDNESFLSLSTPKLLYIKKQYKITKNNTFYSLFLPLRAPFLL